MFLKGTAFKKLIKEAYKEGRLRLKNDGEGITISGGYWSIWIVRELIPKERLANIIELTGQIPEVGEKFCVTAAGNQYEIYETEEISEMETAEKCDTKLNVTKVLFSEPSGVHVRVLQNIENKKIILINDKFVQMVDMRELDYKNGESGIHGPEVGREVGVFWRSNIMTLRVMPRTDEKGRELLEHLEKINLPEGA